MAQRTSPTATDLFKTTDILRNAVTATTTDKLYNLIYLNQEGSSITIRDTANTATFKLFKIIDPISLKFDN